MRPTGIAARVCALWRTAEDLTQEHTHQIPRVRHGLRDRLIGVALRFNNRFGTPVPEERVADVGIQLNAYVFGRTAQCVMDPVHIKP